MTEAVVPAIAGAAVATDVVVESRVETTEFKEPTEMDRLKELLAHFDRDPAIALFEQDAVARDEKSRKSYTPPDVQTGELLKVFATVLSDSFANGKIVSCGDAAKAVWSILRDVVKSNADAMLDIKVSVDWKSCGSTRALKGYSSDNIPSFAGSEDS